MVELAPITHEGFSVNSCHSPDLVGHGFDQRSVVAHGPRPVASTRDATDEIVRIGRRGAEAWGGRPGADRAERGWKVETINLPHPILPYSCSYRGYPTNHKQRALAQCACAVLSAVNNNGSLSQRDTLQNAVQVS
jgi:hypothetical protein